VFSRIVKSAVEFTLYDSVEYQVTKVAKPTRKKPPYWILAMIALFLLSEKKK